MDAPYTIRPIDVWPGEQTTERRWSPFRNATKSMSNTLDLLERELRMLGAENVVLQLAVQEKDIRIDGRLRANARPSHPGVIVAFDSKYGPLKYPCDTFNLAEANLRAVALALEALRKVDRYGVTKRGEQYTGWKQLGDGTGGRTKMTFGEASRFLSEQGGSYRAAAKRLHPDAGGDAGLFAQLQEAREVLGL